MHRLLSTLFACTASLASAQVTVVTPDPINVDAAHARAVRAVCAQAWQRVSGQRATEADLTPELPAPRVELHLIGLDGAKHQRLIVRAVQLGAEGTSQGEATLDALSLEDAPVVCERLARALIEHVAIEDTQTRTTVTTAESVRKARRVSSNKSFGVRTGFLGAFAAGTSLAPLGTLAFDARIEGERWFAALGAGVLIPAVFSGGQQGYGGLALDLGAGYYLLDGDFAPHVALGVQPRLVFSGSVFNLAPWVQVGLTASRKAGVRFNVDARVTQNVLPTVYSAAATAVLPTEVGLFVGVGF